MYFVEYLPYIIRLLVAVIVGGVIGLERSESNHEAGLRTHILVCLGAAVVMVLSEIISRDFGNVNDVTRMGAQVISGVGFLGAGSIIFDQSKNKIKGITTAAGIWTTACVGLVIGMGYYVIAIFLFLLIIFTMLGLRPLTKKLKLKVYTYSIHAQTENRERVEEINNNFRENKIDISSYSIEKNNGVYILDMEIKTNTIINKTELIDEMSKMQDVKKIIIS